MIVVVTLRENALPAELPARLDKCRLIYSHNPSMFYNGNFFDLTLNFLAFTIPILGQYSTGHKNVSHNALSIYAKISMVLPF